jgi:hemolysin III
MLYRFRDPISGLTHLAGALVALAGLPVLLYLGRGDPRTEIALLVYGASLVAMFGSSATYHLVKARPQVTQRLRKLDHSAIYLLIAGTYTPICLHFFHGFWCWGMLGLIWTLALAGIGAKLFIINTPRWLTAGTYLLMGWLAVMASGEMLRAMPAGALWGVLVGGLFYTVGAVVYAAEWPRLAPGKFGFHELWHVFVILGALSHFWVVARYVA